MSGTLNWSDGDTSTKTISIPIINDSAYEGNETFTVTLSNPIGGATLGSPSSTTVTIIDDEVPSYGSLRFENASDSVGENDGSKSVRVTRINGRNGAVGISYSTSDGSATSGSDYTSKSGTLNWSDGDTSTKTISIPITNDSAYEGNETFTVTLSNPIGGATLGSPSSTTVTIIDDEVPLYGSLQFENASDSVGENDGSKSVRVTRINGRNGAVGISYSTSDGSATSGSDYTSKSGTLNWSDGDTSTKTISIPITNDSAYEGNETFTVTLSNPIGGATLGSPSSTTVTIIDDEPLPDYGILLGENKKWSVFNYSAAEVDINKRGSAESAAFVTYDNRCYLYTYAPWNPISGSSIEAYARAGEKIKIYSKNDGETSKNSKIYFNYGYFGDISKASDGTAIVIIKIRLADFDTGYLVETKNVLCEVVSGKNSSEVLDGTSGFTESISANLIAGKTYIAYIQIGGACQSEPGLIPNSAKVDFKSLVSPYKLLRLYSIEVTF